MPLSHHLAGLTLVFPYFSFLLTEGALAPPDYLQPPRRFLPCTMLIPPVKRNLEPRLPEFSPVYRGIAVLIAFSRELCLQHAPIAKIDAKMDFSIDEHDAHC